MIDTQYNLQFETLCKHLQLGEVVSEPSEISGGLLHRMYAVDTTQGKYAIKALNPQIMLRPVAIQNFIDSEEIATLLAKDIPALPAKKFKGNALQQIERQHYLIFDWAAGRSLRLNEINNVHCEKIGAVLADIHKTDFSALGIIQEGSDHEQTTDWTTYLQKGQKKNVEWATLLHEYIDKLKIWNAAANQSAKQLASGTVISHRDLDPKNVLWHQDNPLLIDWESAGYIHPMQDLIETAMYWSENETGDIVKSRFLACIHGYKKSRRVLLADWRTVLASGFTGKLGWLEYSLKRSLGIECTDEKEQQLGTAQVTGTIDAIRRYADMADELERWLLDEM